VRSSWRGTVGWPPAQIGAIAHLDLGQLRSIAVLIRREPGGGSHHPIFSNGWSNRANCVKHLMRTSKDGGDQRMLVTIGPAPDEVPSAASVMRLAVILAGSCVSRA